MSEWMTNDPEVATRLRRIDARYEDARLAAIRGDLTLADKLEAFARAKDVRDTARATVLEAYGIAP